MTALPKAPSRAGTTTWTIVVGALILAAVAFLDVDWGALLNLPRSSWEYGTLMFASPDWEKLPRALFETWRSISMAWLGAILCVALSIPLGMLAAHGVGPAWLRPILRGIFAVIRAVPEVIIALVLLTVTGLTPFTGALALGIAGVGTQGKWTYETVAERQRRRSRRGRRWRADRGAAVGAVAGRAPLADVVRAVPVRARHPHVGGPRSRRRRRHRIHAVELHQLS